MFLPDFIFIMLLCFWPKNMSISVGAGVWNVLDFENQNDRPARRDCFYRSGSHT